MTEKKSTAVSVKETGLTVPSTFDESLKFFTEIARGANTGVKTAGDAMLLYQKAKELGVGWGNAIPHMHVIGGKGGIDIHIVKALLSKPGSGVTWEHIEDNVPLYQYMGEDQQIYLEHELPPNYIIITNFKETPAIEGKFRVAILPTNIEPDPKKTPIYKKLPVNWRSTYIFSRKKKDIDGTFIKVTAKGTFSWQEAVQAGLPFDRKGEINPDAAWNAYRSLMINTRAFTFGAREIASDLLMGNYEVTELFDINKMNYAVTEKNGEIGKVTILDKDGKPIKSPETTEE